MLKTLFENKNQKREIQLLLKLKLIIIRVESVLRTEYTSTFFLCSISIRVNSDTCLGYLRPVVHVSNQHLRLRVFYRYCFAIKIYGDAVL